MRGECVRKLRQAKRPGLIFTTPLTVKQCVKTLKVDHPHTFKPKFAQGNQLRQQQSAALISGVRVGPRSLQVPSPGCTVLPLCIGMLKQVLLLFPPN